MNKSINKISWLASYPKSGNTWVRIFLANYLNQGNQPVNINELNISSISSSRSLFDDYSGISAADLTKDEITNLRPKIYQAAAENCESQIFIKVHDAFQNTPKGKPLFPIDISGPSIYIIRNPLDIVASFAHHSAISLDESINNMNDNNYAFCSNDNKLSNQLEQKLLSWSSHVDSWTSQSSIPILTIRFEDLKNDPINSFSKIIQHLNLDLKKEKLLRAIEFSTFKELKKQETEIGFSERPRAAGSFFRQGKTKSYKNELSLKQQNLVINHHKNVMKKYNYLP